jgi:outer membrane biosynthesis protein TonB
VPKNEDGEFELTLGNRQLLSMFFVVVVLLAVFFVMGYIVGRNSAPSAEPSIARKADTKPIAVDSTTAPTAATPASPAEESPRPLETAGEKPADAKSEPPKSEPTKAVTSKSEPAAKHETKAEKAAEKASEKAQKAEKARPTPSNVPVAGQTYLQLSATTKQDADAYVEVLRKNSFPSIDVEVPGKPGTYRVLVGPLAPGEINKMKADLQAKGLPGNAAFRQSF